MTPREQAEQFYATGRAHLPHDQPGAYRMFASSVYVDPTFKEGWYWYGNANVDLNLRPAAVAAWRRTLELEPNDVNALSNLGHSLHHLGRNDEARAVIKRVLEIDENNAHAWCNLSIIQSVDGHLADSLICARKAFKLDQHPVMEFALAHAHLYAGNWAEGLKHYKSRYAYKLQRFLTYPYPMWDGEDAKEKRILVLQEHGMGDAISFLRFVPLAALHADTIELQVVPELVRFAAMMLRGCENVVVGPLTQDLPAADYWCGLTDLPVALALDDAEIAAATMPEFPYVSLGATVPWKVPGRNFHIGIAWAGNPDNAVDVWRSIEIEQFLDLYRVPGVQLYSLQVGPRAQDIHDRGCVSLVRDLSPYIRDVAETTAIVRDLDLVITVESALRHVCGALNVECWVPYARNGGDWRMGRDRKHPLWDYSTRIFKQGKDATWQPVFDSIVDALGRRIGQ